MPDAGALPVEGVEAPEVPPDEDGAADTVAGDGVDVVAGAVVVAEESEGAVVVAVGVGFDVSPVGGFILSE